MPKAVVSLYVEDRISGQLALDINFQGKVVCLGNSLTSREAFQRLKSDTLALEVCGVEVEEQHNA